MLMSTGSIIIAIIGIAVLMIVHESGHHFAARAFGMRVIRFSIGIGPTLWKHRPRGSSTTYQVALIPFLAYVQIAGMNPLEDIDPEDKGSYANASLVGRITTIFAGPLANYLFASVFFFGSFMIGGQQLPTTKLKNIQKDSAAQTAKLKSGDVIVAIDGAPLKDWDALRKKVQDSPDKKLTFGIERDGKALEIPITPRPKGEGGKGLIGVEPEFKTIPMSVSEAGWRSVVAPAVVVKAVLLGLGGLVTSLPEIISGKKSADIRGPYGIAEMAAKAADRGWADLLHLLGALSAYLGAFNLLPLPALDGGRLMFLGYEAVTRHRPNARIEAQVHAIGLLMFLALIAVVTVFDIRGH